MHVRMDVCVRQTFVVQKRIEKHIAVTMKRYLHTICVYICLYAHNYTHTYIHTYIHTYTQVTDFGSAKENREAYCSDDEAVPSHYMCIYMFIRT